MSARFSLPDAPELIPIFPLPGALLLPRGRLPLNIFEPRYIAMIDDALKTEHRLIGMIQPRSCNSGTDCRALFEIGCAGRLTTLSETSDGRYLIALTGVCRFSVAEEVDGFTPYRRVRADWSVFAEDLAPAARPDPEFDRAAFLEVVRRYLRAKHMETDWESLARADAETVVNALCMTCAFTCREKQALLEAPTLAERRAALQTLLMIDCAGDERSSGGLQ